MKEKKIILQLTYEQADLISRALRAWPWSSTEKEARDIAISVEMAMGLTKEEMGS